MHYIWQHIETIISSYDGSLPLVHFLKNHYKQHPKLGSRDRKMLSEMTYSWYRSGKAVDDKLSLKEKIASCLRLCNTQNLRLLQLIESIPTTTPKSLQALFTEGAELSDGIAKDEWLNSMLTQPDFFIRVRKSKQKIEEILAEQDVPFKTIGESCIAMPNGTDIAQWLPEYTYVVQDASSQKTGDYFVAKPNEQWWDCCSGAGGKSLLLKDKEPLAELTVSDTRKTILNNLKERFRTYSHILPVAFEVDVANKAQLNDIIRSKSFDNIICDVPCTGSGTWARTPEQMYFFKPGTEQEFSERQKKIAVNAAEYLKPGGRLYYITCSVFKAENEDVVKHIAAQSGLTVEKAALINGVDIHADSMFIAVLKK